MCRRCQMRRSTVFGNPLRLALFSRPLPGLQCARGTALYAMRPLQQIQSRRRLRLAGEIT